MNYNFIFFYIDTRTDELSNKHSSIERESIEYFISSIKKYHPRSTVIHCTDLLTKSFDSVDSIHRTKFDTNLLMYGKIKSFSTLEINRTSIYLDPDMLIMRNIPLSTIEKKADVFLLKRSFNNNNIIPTTFRGLKFSKHLNKTYEDIYPYVACLVICKNKNFWQNCLDYFKDIENVYKIWFGDQEIFRRIVEGKKFSFGFVDEKDFSCPPQHLKGNNRPFILHFKGKTNKELIEQYYKYV